jgi:hypothetical protein
MDNNVNKQQCCARNNGRALLWIWRGDIKGTWNEFVSRVWRQVGCGRVYLAAASFEVGRLSSYREIARGAREFIRWTVKTFDRRSW